jgi:hypothetical protein
MLGKHGRIEDYLEIGLQSRYRYNPLAGDDVDAYAFAFGINSVMVNLYGKGDDPFWAQAQVNLIKFLILLHQVVDGYVTLWDVYVCAINPDRVAAKLKAGAWRYGAAESVQVDASDYVKAPGLSELTWTIEPATGNLTTPRTADVDAKLAALNVPYRIVPNTLADPANAVDSSSRQLSAGSMTTGPASRRSCGHPSSRASRCSCQSSTAIPR